MGLFSRPERRSLPSADAFATDGLQAWNAPTTTSGATVNDFRALEHLAVWACQNIIADGFATLPVDVFKRNSDGTRTCVSSKAPFKWLERPNPNQTASEFWQRYCLSLVSDGNAFIALERQGGRVVAMNVLNPKLVEIVPGPNGKNRYRYQGAEFDRTEIVHVPLFAVPGYARGLSPIAVAREAIGLGLTQQEYSARFFSQGASLGGVIEHPSTPKPGEVKALRQMFSKTHSGVKNSHALGILTGGATYKPVTLSPEASQLLESRRFSRTEIAMIYRVPAYMIDPTVSSTWGTGIEEMGRAFVDNVLMPYIVRAEQMLEAFILPDGYFAKFNVSARLRGRTKDRYEAHKIAIDGGWMSPDQVAEIEDMPPLPDGQGKHYYRPLNFYPVDNAPDFSAKGKATPKADPELDPNGNEPDPNDPNEDSVTDPKVDKNE